MMLRANINIKLTLLLIAVSIIPLVIIFFIASYQGEKKLIQQTFSGLSNIREIHKKEIKHYFEDHVSDVTMLSTNTTMLDSLNAFSQAFGEGEKSIGGPVWKRAEEIYGPWLTQYRNLYGYYDLILISHNGDIVFTVAKEADLGINIHSPTLKDSGLNKLFQKAKIKAAIQDFSPYSPSQNNYAAFFGAPIRQQGKLIGVVALQIPYHDINNITNERTGMGETGEVYLVGQDGTSSSYRSKRIVKKGDFGQKKTDKFVKLSLSGSTGNDIKLGSTGNMELVSYAPLDIPELNWAIVVTKGLDEIKQPIYDFQKAILYSITILVFILLIAATAISKYTLHPIQQLLKGIRSIEKGNLAIQIPVLTKDELGELNTAFNQMAEGLLTETNKRKHVEQKLNNTIKLAEAANQAKSEFLSNMSHELRTPMHMILNFADMGMEKITSAPQEKLLHYFTRIHESGDRLLLLLNDLLDLSKLEAGRMVLDFKEHDLHSIVETSLREFSGLVNKKSIILEVEPSEVDTSILCDNDKILQVLRNLLSNAIKFTPGGKRISISFAETLLPSGQRKTDTDSLAAISLIVKDEGIGIPEEELESVFDKFVQSSKTYTGAGGTGLGLAICKEIIEAHGGTIQAMNNPDGGAILIFSIPCQLIKNT